MRGRSAAVVAILTTLSAAACVSSPSRFDQPGSLAPEEPAGVTGSEPAGPLRVTIFSSKKLPAGIVSEVKGLAGVREAGARRSGLVNLIELMGAGLPLPSRPAGTILPLSVEAHDPGLVASFPGLAGEAEALRTGRAVIPRSQADFRGLEVGDTVVLAGAGRVRFRIGSVTDDETLFRSELVLPMAAADRLGLERAPTLILAVDAGEATRIEQALEEIIGDFPARVRLRRPDADGFTSSGRLLSLAEVKTLFGEFWYRPAGGIQISVDPIWRRRNIIEARVPLLGRLQCHRKIVPLLEGAMGELQAMGMGNLVRSFAGCYSPRMQVSDDGDLSRHAFGIAVDINAAANPYGAAPTQDPRLVAVMERWGFSWGGRWSVPDGMHFEFSRFPEASPGS